MRAPFSEFVVERPHKLQPALIYHKLKHPSRFEYVRNHSAALSNRDDWGEATCAVQQLAKKHTWAHASRAARLDCCAAWRGCEWPGFVKWQDVPRRRYRTKDGGTR